MADNDYLSKKTSKKNRKRRGKKEGTSQGNPGFAKQVHTVDPIEDIRQKLSEAKIAKNHELANQLRQQLWIAQDLSAGIEPNVSVEDPDSLALVEEVKKYGFGGLGEKPVKVAAPAPVLSVIGSDADSKRLKNLKKKLKQIEKLKERVQNGEEIESNQLEKIKTENEVLEEIQHVEQLLTIAPTSR